MGDDAEKQARIERAKRLVDARKKATSEGPKALCAKFGWNLNNYKAHEAGRNGFGIVDAKSYAKAYDVSVQWLNFGIGSPDDKFTDSDDDTREVMEILEALPPELRRSQIQNLRNVADALIAQGKQKADLAAARAKE